ncbi:protein-L-isoaspartate(D-aspartate) O-methyltransferase [bacterium]|nr:protein-L-isoaspartate(D-aspartate) O-methyltransferase [bacterium]
MNYVFKIMAVSLLILICGCKQSGDDRHINIDEREDMFTEKRLMMIDQQIKARDINDIAVLNAMKSVPRHLFVPPELATSAYNDSPLPIGYDQTISQPYIVALMTEKLQLKANERVLEIGTGSGYQAAILSKIVAEVYTIEIVNPLVPKAKLLFEKLQYNNIFVKAGDGLKGWPDKAPFDAIIITAAPPRILEELLDQLKDGGRMILPVGEDDYQELMLVEKNMGQIERKRLIPVRFVKMTGEIQKERQ